MKYINSIKDYGWRFFWDAACTIPLKDGDDIGAKSFGYVHLYLACVPEMVSENGTVDKYSIDVGSSDESIYIDMAYVSEAQNSVYLLGSATDQDNMIGSAEEVVLFRGTDLVSSIKDFHLSEKPLYSEELDSYVDSILSAENIGVIEYYTFKNRNNIFLDQINGDTAITVDGDIIQVQGQNLPSIILNENREFLNISSVALGTDYAISLLFKIIIGKDFTVIDVTDSVRVVYNIDNRNFTVYVTMFETETEVSYTSLAIDKLFGDHSRIALVVTNYSIELIFNGETILKENAVPYMSNQIKYRRAVDIVTSMTTDYPTKYYSENKTEYLPASENVYNLISNGYCPYSYHIKTLIGDGEQTERITYFNSPPRIEPIGVYADIKFRRLSYDSVLKVSFLFNSISTVENKKIVPFVFVPTYGANNIITKYEVSI